MTSHSIISRLTCGEHLLLDGATGSELQRRGVFVDKGVREDLTGPWSATAVGDAPEVIRAIHEDYLRAGADIVTTNSFWTNRPMLGLVGLADKAEEYTRLAAEIACEARDRLNPDAFVAGSMCPPRSGNVAKELNDQSKILADAGVDLLLLELVPTVAESAEAVDAVSHTDLPIFLGNRVTGNGTIRTGLGVDTDGAWGIDTGETFGQLMEALNGRRVDAVLPMCSKPEEISVALPKLRQVYDGPIGAYGNLGYQRGPRQFPRIIDPSDYLPDRYAQFASEWIDMGAQVVGGCCSSRPQHIAALRPLVDAVNRS